MSDTETIELCPCGEKAVSIEGVRLAYFGVPLCPVHRDGMERGMVAVVRTMHDGKVSNALKVTAKGDDL